MPKGAIVKNIKIDNHKFELEIYPRLECTRDIAWEIFSENYDGCLYAFSNKEKIIKTVEDKYIFEPKKNK